MEYKIIANSKFKQTEDQVNIHIKDGWLPLGGLCFILQRQCAQAMTRTRKPKPTKNKKALSFSAMDVVDLYNDTFNYEKVGIKRAPITTLLNRIHAISFEHFNTIEDWTKFFESLKLSPFLMGNVPPGPGYSQFKLKLEWIIKPVNLAKIIDGNFHED